MKILNDIPINLQAEEVLRAQFMGRRKHFAEPMLTAAQQAIELGQTLFAPTAIYDEFPVLGFEDEDLLLGVNGTTIRLEIGPKIDLLYPAQRVIVSVDTIGPALEQRVDELQASREPLDSYMLDSVGVLALGAVGDKLREIAEERAQELNWGVGAALAPGSLLGWHMRGQRELCALLPLQEINVVLSNSGVLEPHKSASMLVGIGPDYTSARVGSVCRFCSLAENCWRRKKDQDDDSTRN